MVEAQAHISNWGVCDVIVKINEVRATTHDEWYGNLCDHTSTLDKGYDHVAVDKSSNKETKQGMMDGTIP